jgi:2'-phosphotransferase
MAASVLVPMSTISLNGGVLPPSAVSHNSPRHGRSRAPSMTKRKSGYRQRGMSLVEERDAVVGKALAFVLRRARKSESEDGDASSDDGSITADAEGWVDLDDVVRSDEYSLRPLMIILIFISSWNTPRSPASRSLSLTSSVSSRPPPLGGWR